MFWRIGIRLDPLRYFSSRLAGVSLLCALGCSLVATTQATAGKIVLSSGDEFYGLVVTKTRRHWLLLTDDGLRTFKRDDVATVDPEAVQPLPVAATSEGGDTNVDDAQGRLGTRYVDPRTSSVELIIRGEIGAEKLTNDHERTRARFGDFLVHRSSPAMLLLGPAQEGESRGPKPDYRMILDIDSRFVGHLSFYGLQLGSRYRCKLEFSLERMSGNRVRVVETLSLVEDVTGTRQGEPGELVSQAYEVAADRLVNSLEKLEVFGGRAKEDPEK